jgi:hypothetical protein
MPLTKVTQNLIEGIVSTGSTGLSAGSFIVGQQYKITSLGTTTQSQWNTIAGTTGQTYVVGSLFTAATIGSGSGTGAAAAARTLANRFADVVNVKDFGAVGDGVADDTAAFNNAQFAVGTSGTLIVPKGNYLVSGIVYPVQGNFQWTNKGFTSGINLPRSARAAAQLITVETSNASPEDFTLSRGGLSVTAIGRGAQHCDGIFSGITNYSTDGDGNTAIYTSVTTDTVSFWAVGTHSESRHGGGLTSCFNAEAQSYTTAGSFYGSTIVNTTIPGLIHATTGQPTVAHPTATGIFIQGGNNTDPMGGWVYGINFGANSMRANGTCILVSSNALVRSFVETASGSASAIADILLSGNSANGIILNGTYSGVALRIKDNQSIGWNTSGTIKSSFDGSTDWGIYTGSTVRASFDLSVSPSLKLNGTKVVGIKQTGWSAMTGTANNSTSYDTSTITLIQLAERVKSIQDSLTTHGLIGA